MPNPYRRDTPYIPSCDLPRRGQWSNCLWFIMDILRPKTRKFYRRPLQRAIRNLFNGGIEKWNNMWAALECTVPYFDDLDNMQVCGINEQCWPLMLQEGLAHACFVEDHIVPDNPHISQWSVFDLWSDQETNNRFNYFRKLRP